MPKTSKITMDWDRLAQQNPNLAADLDRLVIEEEEPERCFRYKRQRNRGEGPVRNPRKCVNYDDQRMQVGVHRLIKVRSEGRIEAGQYVGHPKPKEHGACANPDHLRCYVPVAHWAKPQAEWTKRLKPQAERPKRTPNHCRKRKLA